MWLWTRRNVRAQFVAQIATSLGADGAVVAEEGYGNPDADFVGCSVALEDAGD